jgi:hypothetical protein
VVARQPLVDRATLPEPGDRRVGAADLGVNVSEVVEAPAYSPPTDRVPRLVLGQLLVERQRPAVLGLRPGPEHHEEPLIRRRKVVCDSPLW